MIDRPLRKGSTGCGVVFAILAPIVFAILFMFLYGFKTWMINRQSNQAHQRQREARAAVKALQPPRPKRTWESPDDKYALLYYKDDVHSSRKRVQLKETGTGEILSSFETDAELDCLWRDDSHAFALQLNVRGESMESTVWFLENDAIRKIDVASAIEKLLIYEWKRPWKHFVGIWSWEGDVLVVDWLGKPIIRKAGHPDKFAMESQYRLELVFDDAGAVLIGKATCRKWPPSATF